MEEMTKSLRVIYRYCDKETPESRMARPKEFGTKRDLVCKSLTSLVNSLASASRAYIDLYPELTLVGDNVDPATDITMQGELGEYLDGLGGRRTERSNLPTNVTGNAASIGHCLDIAYNCKEDLIFFMEDDYILHPDCIKLMVGAQEHFSSVLRVPVCMHPTDYPDRYTGKVDPCVILLHGDRHWRTIYKTTGTFLIPRDALLANWQNISKFRYYGLRPGCDEDSTINTTYRTFPCFSPIPGLAHHLQYIHTLSPYLDLDAHYKY